MTVIANRLALGTSYDKMEAGWENIFNFVLNRYIATKFMCHLRYDDSVLSASGLNHFQLKEMFSFGLSYNRRAFYFHRIVSII